MKKRKYRIEELVQGLPKWQNEKWIVAELEKEGITQRTYYRHKAIELGDAHDIPSYTLLIYARFFGVTVDELFNYSSKTKPASKRKAKTL